ncbi:MAG: extracellular solute-binding protein family 1, partial [Lacrimispora sp.]|nr:extracellular solute-binding protein family 1 [Lacrimispora sp.]
MRKWKKLGALGMASLMVMSVMAGCQGNQKTQQATTSAETVKTEGVKTEGAKTEGDKTDNAAPVVLRMWGGVPAEAGPQAVCDNFNQL